MFYRKVSSEFETQSYCRSINLKSAPKTYKRYVDDAHPRFKSKEQSRKFQKILNKQDKHIQFTIEDEIEEKCLNILDIKRRNNNGRYEFDVQRKPALTNVQIPLTQLPVYSKDFLQELPKSVLKNI